MEIVLIPVDEISIHPACPNIRDDINDIDDSELINSISESGLQQPISVFRLPTAEGKEKTYLVAGERRLRAYRKLAEKNENYTKIPAIIREYKGKTEAVINAVILDNMIENLQRENVNILDLAKRLRWLQDSKKMDRWAISKSIGKSVSWFDQTIKLLDLPETAKKKLRDGEIKLTEARAISKLPKEVQEETATVLANTKKSGDKKETKKLKKAIDEAGKVRSTSMITSKKDIEKNRNILIVVMSEMKAIQKKAGWTDAETKIYYVLQGSLDCINWILGHTKEWSLHKLLTKYNINIDESGNRKDPNKTEKAEKNEKTAKIDKPTKPKKSK